MLTISVSVLLLVFTFRKNFHLALPDFINKILEVVDPSNQKFEWQVKEGPLSIDITLAPAAIATPAPASKEVAAVPVGTVVHQDPTPEAPPSGSSDNSDVPASPVPDQSF